MRNIVFSFNYEGIEYVVVKENNDYVPYKRIDNNLNFKLTDKELSIVKQVFDKVKITNNQIKLSNLKYKNKEYKHFFDKTNNYHIFYNLDDSEIDKNIFSELNILFNNQSEFMYDNITNDNKFKRIVKIGKSFVVVLAASTALINPFANLTPVNAKSVKTESVQTETKELSSYQKIENLKNAIYNNENLTNKEKEFFISCFDVVYDNIDLLDYELVEDRYANFYIEYDTTVDKQTGATYNYVKNFIHVYGCEDLKSANKAYLAHEFFHMLQAPEIHELGNGIYEPLNDILLNEYKGIQVNKEGFRTYSIGYNCVKPYIYTLLEIIDPEVIRTYNFTGSYEDLKKELMNIIDDESKFYDLMSYLRLYIQLKYKNSKTSTDIGEYNYSQYVGNEIIKILKDYYENKYKTPMNENVEIMSLLNPGKVNKYMLNKNLYIQDERKVYFNTRYKDKYSKSIIKIYKNFNDMPYLDGIKLLKDKKVIDNNAYNTLKELFNEYKNKKISFNDFEDQVSNYFDIDITNKDNPILLLSDVGEYVELDDDKFDKKDFSKAMGNEYDATKLILSNLDFTELDGIDLNNIKDLDYSKKVLTLTTDNDKIYTISSEYANNVFKTVYMDLLDARLKSSNDSNIVLSVEKGVLSVINYSKDEVYNIDLKTGKKASAKKLSKITKTSKSNTR